MLDDSAKAPFISHYSVDLRGYENFINENMSPCYLILFPHTTPVHDFSVAALYLSHSALVPLGFFRGLDGD